MKTRSLGVLGEVSALTLGGGGIGMLWGPTTRDEAAATLKEAIDAGISLLDTAPGYAQCESIIGEVFNGRLPHGVRITSKCGLGSPPAHEIAPRLEESLRSTLTAMRLQQIDLFFLHSNICADDYTYVNRPDLTDRVATRWSLYLEQVVPTFERWRAEGRIRAWGITGTGVPRTIRQALVAKTKPQAVQVITNLLDSAGGIRRFAEPAEPRAIVEVANQSQVPVMGIRAVQAGALTKAIDRELSPNHPDQQDYVRAQPFRDWCARKGEDPALIAHQYALSLPGVATVVLGVKNREELRQCLNAEARGPMDAVTLGEIDALAVRKLD